PRHTFERALRIPQAILEQNAGKDTAEQLAAQYLGLKLTGPTRSEISSAIKYGFLERPVPKQLRPTDLSKQVLRPHEPGAKIAALRTAAMKAPVFADVYAHYRG